MPPPIRFFFSFLFFSLFSSAWCWLVWRGWAWFWGGLLGMLIAIMRSAQRS